MENWVKNPWNSLIAQGWTQKPSCWLRCACRGCLRFQFAYATIPHAVQRCMCLTFFIYFSLDLLTNGIHIYLYHRISPDIGFQVCFSFPCLRSYRVSISGFACRYHWHWWHGMAFGLAMEPYINMAFLSSSWLFGRRVEAGCLYWQFLGSISAMDGTWSIFEMFKEGCGLQSASQRCSFGKD